ncbi:protein GRAVITROPIC IN THE LIGHT 1-like [Humulus lupulus]|uniref:protein GRAVITROPIC IN THE LIGHT 1-like n=1 Tax=Humulus lupulus TaxID=3486 RepID=UPI002B413985|nr:protein GRAVITROPIC IN THE LIGHT 1-like [Humulus lupulus]XP_062096486.1 protein GRAVITROPIC IN THE LIGHT 1-like [Humulus lupulus]XP_062096487.1 protein GRAVITROPIC IN THE LIGHT 1-like [Humulus lupulus]
MDSVKPSAVTPHKNKLARTIAKVLHLRAAATAGIAPVDAGIQKVGIQIVKATSGSGDKIKVKDDRNSHDDEEHEERMAMEALLAKLFASISTVKSSYAQLQFSQSPYDVDGIQAADRMVVSELKNLSELKRCYLKKQFDPSPETALIIAEIQEQKSLLKTYEITVKKLESQARLKDSEVIFLREKIEEANKQNKLFEKKLNQSGQLLCALDNLHLSGLSPSHFITVLRHAIRSIRSFVRIMIEEMKSANWDFNAAAYAIQPEVVYWREEHKVFAFESFASREMFDGFCYPNFVFSKEQSLTTKQRERFFSRFMELKSLKPKDCLSKKPRSGFANFCRLKYLKLIHPKMEVSFFGDQSYRNLIQNNGEFPIFSSSSSSSSSTFLASFFEMAKRVWLLHCLAFSFEPQASIFQARRGCRFSEVYMGSIAEEVFPLPENDTSFSSQESDSHVAFTVIPGFRIGKTVIQSKVYLSQILQ